MTAARKGSVRRFPAQVQRAIDAAQGRKAGDVVVLDLRPAEGFTDYFVIATGRNVRQIVAIADAVRDALAERGVKPAHVEGGDKTGWILLDYFDFIIHIFSPEARSFYALERLWGNATRIDIPDSA
ncbi:MAG: ribosome silencing factor [Vicinamibacterales bacterium]|nr:ribosome silencing factor [Vicinamibacterales bacterium]